MIETINAVMLDYNEIISYYINGYDVLPYIQVLYDDAYSMYMDFSALEPIDDFADSQYYMTEALISMGIIFEYFEEYIIAEYEGAEDEYLELIGKDIVFMLELLEEELYYASQYYFIELEALKL